MDDPGLFPIAFQHDELQWKISVGFDPHANSFTLSVNGVDFREMNL